MKNSQSNSNSPKPKQAYVDINPNVKRVGGTAYIDTEIILDKIKELNSFLNNLVTENKHNEQSLIERKL